MDLASLIRDLTMQWGLTQQMILKSVDGVAYTIESVQPILLVDIFGYKIGR